MDKDCQERFTQYLEDADSIDIIESVVFPAIKKAIENEENNINSIEKGLQNNAFNYDRFGLNEKLKDQAIMGSKMQIKRLREYALCLGNYSKNDCEYFKDFGLKWEGNGRKGICKSTKGYFE